LELGLAEDEKRSPPAKSGTRSPRGQKISIVETFRPRETDRSEWFMSQAATSERKDRGECPA